MKAKRLLFLVMAICLASGVKAQFYDSADDVCFYILDNDNGYYKSHGHSHGSEVLVLNFDGKGGCWWYEEYISDVKKRLSQNSNYYVEDAETRDYSHVKYISSTSTEVTYEWAPGSKNHMIWKFTKDRNFLTEYHYSSFDLSNLTGVVQYKRVDKSFFKLGRSRKPSGTMYE